MAYASYRCQVATSEHVLWDCVLACIENYAEGKLAALTLDSLPDELVQDLELDVQSWKEKVTIDHAAHVVTFKLDSKAPVQGYRQIRIKVDENRQIVNLECILDWQTNLLTQTDLSGFDRILEELVKTPLLRLKSLAEEQKAC